MEKVSGWRDELVRRCGELGVRPHVFERGIDGLGIRFGPFSARHGRDPSICDDFAVSVCALIIEIPEEEHIPLYIWILSTFPVIEIVIGLGNDTNTPYRLMPVVNSMHAIGYKGDLRVSETMGCIDVATAVPRLPCDLSAITFVFDDESDCDLSFLYHLPTSLNSRLLLVDVATPGEMSRLIPYLQVPVLRISGCNLAPKTKTLDALVDNTNLKMVFIEFCHVQSGAQQYRIGRYDKSVAGIARRSTSIHTLRLWSHSE